jgi:hypothetical protein
VTFKLCVLWDVWTPKVTNRIIIDLLTLQRFFGRQRIDLEVCAKVELSDALKALGIACAADFSNCDLCRIYVETTREIPEEVLNAVPEGCEYDACYLDPQDTPPPTLVVDDPDPYGRFPLPYPGKVIPQTLQPRYYRKKLITEPFMAPFIAVALCIILLISNLGQVTTLV